VKDWRGYRRARRGWYSLLERRPAAYCAYRRRRQPVWPVVSASTDLVIDGRPGCGNSFAREAMLLANPGINLASHVHSTAQVLEGIRLRKPVLVIIRDPVDAVASEAARFEAVDVRRELVEFARFYERLWPRAGEFVIATFERVTSRFDQVTAAVNARFASQFALFPHDDASAVERVFETLADYDRSLGLAEGRAAIPTKSRAARDARARSILEDPRHAQLVRRCNAAYARFAGLERAQSERVGEREPVGLERRGSGVPPGELGGAL
jgi:hypothetical protein